MKSLFTSVYVTNLINLIENLKKMIEQNKII